MIFEELEVKKAVFVYEQYDNNIKDLWEGLGRFAKNSKNKIVIAYGVLAHQHTSSAVKLAEMGVLGSARALARPAIEACGRSMFIAYIRDEVWCDNAIAVLQKMQCMVDSGNEDGIYDLEEKTFLPNLGQLEKKLREIADKESRELFYDLMNGLMPVLNSFTHGGISHVGRLIGEDSVEEPFIPGENAQFIISMAYLHALTITVILKFFGQVDDSFRARLELNKLIQKQGFS